MVHMFGLVSLVQASTGVDLLAILRAAGVLALIALLVARELAAHAGPAYRRLMLYLSIALIPLLGLFVLTIISITLQYLSQAAPR